MSLYSAAQMGQQLASQQPGGVAYGHVPQQPNLGLGPNRYVPPTFNWGRGGLDGRQPQYNQMDWNQMQAYYMPQHQNSPFTGGYMGQLQQMLGMFGNQFGGPNRRPVMPQFGSYNPGFGGPTSFFDQQRSGSFGGFGDSFGGYIGDMRQRYPNADRIEMGIGDINVRGGGMGGGGYSGPDYGPGEGMSYTAVQPRANMEYRHDQSGQRYEVPRGGGGGRSPYGSYEEFEQAALASGRQPGQYMSREAYGDGGGGRGGGYSRWDTGDFVNPGTVGGGVGGFPSQGLDGFSGFADFARRQGGYPQMPQFNPYMLARNNMQGMDFNQMFDPRYAMLFGMGGLGAMTPNGPQQQRSGLKPGQLGGGG